MLPGAGAPERARKIAEGLRTSRRPDLAHVEERQLAHRAEPVLGGPHVAKTAGSVAFEIEHGVDQVFEHARTGNGAILGHMADDDDADARALGEAHQLGGAFLELRNRPGRGADGSQLHGLDGVDDEQLHALLAGARHHGFEIRIGDHAQVRTGHAEAPRTQTDLRRGLFRRQIQRRRDAGRVVRELQQQRGFADARFST